MRQKAPTGNDALGATLASARFCGINAALLAAGCHPKFRLILLSKFACPHSFATTRKPTRQHRESF